MTNAAPADGTEARRLRGIALLMTAVAAAGLTGCPFAGGSDDQAIAAPLPSPPPPPPAPSPPPPPAPAPGSPILGAPKLWSIFFVSYARLADGSLRSCGREAHGELGDGGAPTGESKTPGAVAALSGVTSVSGGGYTGVAVRSDGTTWSWGNAAGDATSPTMTAGVNTATAACISTGSSTVAEGLALLADGTVHTGLGAGPAVAGIADATAIACGGAHYLALLADGTVMAWGSNDSGQLGNGTIGGSVAAPGAAVSGLSGVVAIAVGGVHSLALRNDGSLWAWGGNQQGQLGDGSTTDRGAAAAVPSFSGAVRIAAGRFNSMTIRSDGTAYIWGNNDAGQLANGLPATSPAFSATPLAVPGLSGVTDVVAGDFNTAFAVLADGSVKAWGYDPNGQLCFGATGGSPNISTPQTVPGLNLN